MSDGAPTRADFRAEPLRGKKIVLGVAGGIAAYKAAELVRLFVTDGAEVRVVMTKAACEFITPLTFQTLSGHPVATELFDLTQESEIGHIRLAQEADLFVVAPTTADVIARLAAGMGNDLLTTVALVARAPMLLAPAMNVLMWSHELVQRNVATLRSLGRVHFVGPGEGFLACRMTGPGRLAEPADIVEAARHLLTPQDLAGKKVLITAGPTREAIDPVRYVSNRSSGKMGYAIARAALARGADVTLVTGPTALTPPVGVEVVRVSSAVEMHDATIGRSAGAHVVVMAAAVADFRPEKPAGQKLKKDELGAGMSVGMTRNPDILAELGRARQAAKAGKGGPVLVGFAAETEDVEARARAKRVAKGCDLVVANDVSQADAGFDVDTNRVLVVGADDKVTALPLAGKDEVAHQILDRVRALL